MKAAGRTSTWLRSTLDVGCSTFKMANKRIGKGQLIYDDSTSSVQCRAFSRTDESTFTISKSTPCWNTRRDLSADRPKMSRSRAGNQLAKQLLRSGTSPLPNHGRSSGSGIAQDFLHKMRICLKELRETKRWLLLAQRAPLIQSPTLLDPILQETEELIRIFVASIRTAVSKQRR